MGDGHGLQGTSEVQGSPNERLKALRSADHSCCSTCNRREWVLWQCEGLPTWRRDLDKKVKSHVILSSCLVLLVCCLGVS